MSEERLDDDAKLLASIGYKQELSRRMSAFSNFAISFSIICILAGGISAFPSALGAGGGASIGIGWLVGACFAGLVAAGMAQIASAYPTAGGLYHWGSILGGKGFGWTAAWFNLLGLVFVTASVNFGVYDPFFKSLFLPALGVDTSNFGFFHQTLFIAGVTLSQALLNHLGIRLTTRLTDLSGYLIFVVAISLIVSLLVFSPVALDFGRLFTLTNFTGMEGSAWPQHDSVIVVFLLGLLLTIYTITGFDASAHTAEETKNAASNVPKGIMNAVFWSALFGYIMVCTFVLVMPNLTDGVKQGLGFLDALLGSMPAWLKLVLATGILVCNYLCGLACVTSASRMTYAFARDGGLPLSNSLKQVDDTHKTPVNAIWVAAVAAIVATLYGDAFLVLATGSAVLLYISYIMPIAAGIWAEGRTWTHKGPFNLGAFSKVVAVMATLGGLVLVWVGVQPPNDKVLYLIVALGLVLLVLWWGLGVRNSFQGPPSLNKTMR